jgi:Fe-S cluster assembly protein SufD
MKLFGQMDVVHQRAETELSKTVMKHVENLELPTSSEEDWRYGAIESLDFLRARNLNWGAGEAVGELDAEIELWESRLGHDFDCVVGVAGSRFHLLRNGRAGEVTVTAKEPSLGACLNVATEPFADIADLVSLQLCEIRVSKGVGASDTPPRVLILGSAGGDDELSTSRVSVVVESGVAATVVEIRRGGGVGTVHLARTTVTIEPEGQLAMMTLQDLGDRATELGYLDISVEQSGLFRSLHLALGSGYGRLRTQCDLVGEGAEAELLAGYLGGANQTLEFRTFQNHNAPRTKSNLLYKGALAGAAHAVYTGTIKVAKGASGSVAFQTNRNLILGDDAQADSVPNLDIEENDVKCSHASAVGPVDLDQVYYLESKGIDAAKAERMIVGGSFRDLVASAGFDSLRQLLEERLVQKW